MILPERVLGISATIQIFFGLAIFPISVSIAPVTFAEIKAGWLPEALDRVAAGGSLSLEFLLGVGLFYVVYTLAPARRPRPESALVAAIVAALAFEAAQKVYTIYVARFATIDRLISDANAIAVALFILWVYYSACMFLLGAEVGVAYEDMRNEREQPAAMEMSPP